MNNPLGVSPSKGNQGTTRGKEKSFDLGGNRTHVPQIRSTVTLPTELRGRTENQELGTKRHEPRAIKLLPLFIYMQILPVGTDFIIL